MGEQQPISGPTAIVDPVDPALPPASPELPHDRCGPRPPRRHQPARRQAVRQLANPQGQARRAEAGIAGRNLPRPPDGSRHDAHPRTNHPAGERHAVHHAAGAAHATDHAVDRGQIRATRPEDGRHQGALHRARPDHQEDQPSIDEDLWHHGQTLSVDRPLRRSASRSATTSWAADSVSPRAVPHRRREQAAQLEPRAPG